jgi:chitodextrinase
MAAVVAALGYAIALPSHAGTTVYTYDVHGRLKTVATPNGSDQTVTTNTYDDAGNRESVVVEFDDITPPNPPTNLTASAQAFDRIRLNWTTSLDVGGGPVSYYKVYRGGIHVASPNVPPYDDQPLAASTQYTYTVSAVDPSGNESAPCASASATTPAGPDLVAPSVPSNLQGVAVSGTQVNLSWSPSTDTGGSGLAGYEIFRDGGSNPIDTSPVASYSDLTASVATTHLYKVDAYDGAGNRSGFSNQISVTTPDTSAPSAPGNPTFSSITGSSATATWTSATDNVGVTGYRYSLNGGSSWTTIANVLTADLTGLTRATTYTMLVQARDAAGNWGPSASGAFTTANFYTDAMWFVGSYTTDGSTYISQGYIQGAMGALSPDTTADGKTIFSYRNHIEYFTGAAWTYLIVRGFNGNPGANWLQSISGPGGATFTGASAFFGCSSSTQCEWSWPTAVGGFDAPATLTIVHE